MKLQSTQVWKSVSLQAGKGGSCPLPTASAGGQPLRDSPARQVGLPADTCLSSHIPQGRTGGRASAASSLPQGARPGRDICLEGTFQEGPAEVALGPGPGGSRRDRLREEAGPTAGPIPDRPSRATGTAATSPHTCGVWLALSGAAVSH